MRTLLVFTRAFRLPRLATWHLLCVAAIVTGLSVLGLSATAFVQRSACTPGVRSVEDHPFGYRQRGDRCEGIYWRPYAGASGEIIILSLLPSSPATAAVPPEVWPVTWPKSIPGSDGVVQLHATGLRRGLYYRMDAAAALQAGRYDWTTDVLRGLSLRTDEVSLRAETKVRVGGQTWPALLPLWIGGDMKSAPEFVALVSSTTPLYAVTWECLQMNSAGMPGAAVGKGKLDGPFKADEPFPLPLRVRNFSGFCYVELNGEAVTTPASGAPTTSAVVFLPASAGTPDRGAR